MDRGGTMALIQCSECGKSISDKANACPGCGCPAESFKEPSPQTELARQTEEEVTKAKKEIEHCAEEERLAQEAHAKLNRQQNFQQSSSQSVGVAPGKKMSGDNITRCPFCAETIQDNAIKCSHCGSMLKQQQNFQQSSVQPAKVTPDKNKNWYLEVLKKYAVFNGRASRKEYWYYFLFNAIIWSALAIIDGITGTFETALDLGLLSGIYTLCVLIPGIAVTVRRFHDTGRSSWWLLIALIPLIGAIVLLVFLVQDSKPGENQYGKNLKME
jgi:uncharacterized membrane protein YhaH (DUF805 family)